MITPEMCSDIDTISITFYPNLTCAMFRGVANVDFLAVVICVGGLCYTLPARPFNDDYKADYYARRQIQCL